VLIYAVIAVVVVLVIAALVWAASRTDRGDETDRFLRARELTREWSDPKLGPPAPDAAAGPEDGDDTEGDDTEGQSPADARRRG
jgi:hypothetical protein